ncbi:MAG: histone deacetylase family protein [Crenarchaeota archaeon]|nr:histone deacetylase family protein [Thermoproteota archaeon]
MATRPPTSNKITIYHSDIHRQHHPPPGIHHPENPERITKALQGLRKAGILEEAETKKPQPAKPDQLEASHTRQYIEAVRILSESGGGWLDQDTYVAPGTWTAALHYVGATLQAIRSNKHALILLRPPGHHAGVEGRAMGAPTLGFCIFNATATAAQEKNNTLILDIDVHHGNGTQEILYTKPIPHIDIHQHPATLYPGTGWPWQTGMGEGKGTKHNIILPPGCGDDCYQEALKHVEKLLEEYKPHTILIDTGLDAYRGDGLADLRATTNTYHTIGRLAAKHAKQVILVLEGGYTIGLKRALPALIAGLLGKPNPYPEKPTRTHKDTIQEMKRINKWQ